VPPDPPADEVLELIGSPESVSTDSATEREPEVDEVALQILGEVPGDAQPDTADLHPAVLKRWTHWVYHGLEPEERAELLSFYPIPADSVFLAPPLNEKLKAHLDKVATARDRHLLTTQECLGAGLLAVGQALSTLVADNESLDRAFVLQSLSDAGKLLSKWSPFSRTVQQRNRKFFPHLWPYFVFRCSGLFLPDISFQTSISSTENSRQDGQRGRSRLQTRRFSLWERSRRKGQSGAGCRRRGQADVRRPIDHIIPESVGKWRGSGRQEAGSLGAGPTKKRPAAERPSSKTIRNDASPTIQHLSSNKQAAIDTGSTPTVEVSNLAGRISAFYHAWELLTDDSFILNTVQGYRLVFERPPSQLAPPPPPRFDRGFSEEEVAAAIRTLEEQQAISRCLPVEGQFLNTFFLVPKPGTETRFVLNCKKLNVFLEIEKFQLEDGRTALGLLSPGDFFGKLDFAQAYYSVAIHPESRCFLRFTFRETLYEFRCLPFGLCTGPWVFTKLLKPVVQFLRRRGFRSVIYLDDLLCFGESQEECEKNIRESVELFQSLDFRINSEKSVLVPTTTITFLGLTYDSLAMTVALPQEKRGEVLERVSYFSQVRECTIREWASFLGLLNFCCFAIPYGTVYLKLFEHTKFLALLRGHQDFDARTTIPQELNSDFQWWLSQLPTAVSPIRRQPFCREIFTDASNTGWGAFYNGTTVGGPWSPTESLRHINHKELLATLYGLRNFAADLQDCSVLLRLDNTTAVTYVNKMSGIQLPHLNAVAREIWQFCETRRIWLAASYIPSAQNVEADCASRALSLDTEWVLGDRAFQKICAQFGEPEIDLFAAPENTKCQRFCSWFPAPGAEKVDAFTLHWGGIGFFTPSHRLL